MDVLAHSTLYTCSFGLRPAGNSTRRYSLNDCVYWTGKLEDKKYNKWKTFFSFLFLPCLFTHSVTIVISPLLPNQTNLAKCGFRLNISFLCEYSQPASKVVHLFCDDEKTQLRKSLLISLKHSKGRHK